MGIRLDLKESGFLTSDGDITVFNNIFDHCGNVGDGIHDTAIKVKGYNTTPAAGADNVYTGKVVVSNNSFKGVNERCVYMQSGDSQEKVKVIIKDNLCTQADVHGQGIGIEFETLENWNQTVTHNGYYNVALAASGVNEIKPVDLNGLTSPLLLPQSLPHLYSWIVVRMGSHVSVREVKVSSRPIIAIHKPSRYSIQMM